MEPINIQGKQHEFLSIYNSSDDNIAIYISSDDRLDYTEDMKTLIGNSKDCALTVSSIIEEIDIAVLINKDEAIKQLNSLIDQIERWKKNG